MRVVVEIAAAATALLYYIITTLNKRLIIFRVNILYL
jgi:hypothetical protein